MMYVIQTKSGCELSVSNVLKRLGFDVKVPEKIMSIHRQGKWVERKYLVFTGYIFIEITGEITPYIYYSIKNTDGVINFLGKGTPTPITEVERQYINWLWNGGEPIKPSKVFKTNSGEIMIMTGILIKYREGYIDFDIRHRRAKVKISFCGVRKKVTLPIKII